MEPLPLFCANVFIGSFYLISAIADFHREFRRQCYVVVPCKISAIADGRKNVKNKGAVVVPYKISAYADHSLCMFFEYFVVVP